MPRPPWNPDERQARLLAEIVELFHQQDRAQAEADAIGAHAWAKVHELRASGAPKDEIADRIPRGRPTVYRHLPKKDRGSDPPNG